MPQDFYVKLPFYVTEGTVPRYVSVSFDGEEVVSKTEIKSRDIANPDMIEFFVSKEPGIYNMVISVPDHDFGEPGAVVLKHFFIKNEGAEWYEMAYLGINSDQKTILANQSETIRAPKFCTIAGFWFGDDITFNMEIPADWNQRYTCHNSTEALAIIEAIRVETQTGTDWLEEDRTRVLQGLERYENLVRNLSQHIANNT
jgi:hypothetical protein